MKIPEIPLQPTPTSDEGRAAIGFKWNAQAGTRHKLGGDPSWLGEPQLATCGSCGQAMTFYGQLDSIGDAYALADCGVVFVFVCFGCFTTAAILQSS